MKKVSDGTMRQLVALKDDIEYTKETGIERQKGLKPRIRKGYLKVKEVPVIGKLSKTTLAVYRSHWTSERVISLEYRIASLEHRIRQLEKNT